ncbi:MAG: MBL fold metallo-hydrolase [Candidatus Limnocylindrales bacterium]
MHATPQIDRRTFIADLGRGAFALAVISVAGCGPSAASGSGTGSTPSAGSATGGPTSPPSSGGSGAAIAWERVNLGFVSAYILSRGGEAAIVDTGVAGSADAIRASLTGISLDWSAVGHVILTHHHRDHAGSAADILGLAPDAVAYAGAEDIPSITVPRVMTAVADGDEVFGLRIVTTPGHTLGSISVLDPAGGFLVVGDALRTAGGQPSLPGADFTVDMAMAKQSIVKLGGLAFETLLVGHGDPLEGGASAAVAKLGAADQPPYVAAQNVRRRRRADGQTRDGATGTDRA